MKQERNGAYSMPRGALSGSHSQNNFSGGECKIEIDLDIALQNQGY